MKYIYLLAVLFVFTSSNTILAQCGGSEFCNGNTGLYSNDDATNIAYDNMGSCYHSTYIKEPNGEWKTWGANMTNNGNAALSPISINSINYPLLTGTIYKVAVGSDGVYSQLIVLTSDGLFVGGSEGEVFSDVITTSQIFKRITVNGKTDGLPLNVGTGDIKMLFASTGTLMITTCLGEVFVLSQNISIRGNGGSGSATQWSKVMINATTPLTNIIVSRGNGEIGFALKSDGTLWTWGTNTNLGDGTSYTTRNYATQMTLPAGMPGVKMIQATIQQQYSSYYILGTDKKVYTLGDNSDGQLGDRTTINRTSWVNAKNPDNSIITDAAWISANEHDSYYAGLGVIKFGGLFFTAGVNSYFMIGRDIEDGINFLKIPNGVSSTDVITHAEVGGHSTALVRLGSIRYGYVGHRINGSMGDGSSLDEEQETFDFITPPIVAVCGTLCVQPTITPNSPVICPGSDAVFTISGTPGDIITYTLNSGGAQTTTIGTDGTVQVTVAGAIVNQNINLTFILGGTGACSNFLSTTSNISINSSVTPTFTQVASICSGGVLNPLPTTSTNGITGTWAPALDTNQTTLYTFTPTITGTCITNATMTIQISTTTVPTFTQVNSICEGATLNALPLTSNNGIVGTWLPVINNLQTTTYTFTPNGGSCVDLVTMTVVVNPKPTPIFTQVAPICEGNTLANLPIISTNNITGTWLPAVNNLATTTYNFTPFDFCATTVPMTIIVNTKINPVFANFETICYGDSVFDLPLVSTNGISGTWSPAFSNTQSSGYIFTPNINECAFPGATNISVYNDFDFDYKKYCLNGNLLLEVFPLLNSFDGSTSSYNWNLNSVNVGNEPIFNITSYLKNTTAIETLPLSFEITVTTIDGCPKTKSIPIKSIYCDIQKGVSPNNDGLNEFFDLRLLFVKHLSIFNRYGVKVYSKEGYTEEWHGQADNGSILPDATYFYVIDFESGDSKTGWIYINKEQ
jgi:gliding motility-associated-like protein